MREFSNLIPSPRFYLRMAVLTAAMSTLVIGLPAQSADFGTETPSVNDIISNLQGAEGSAIEGVRTRALRPGAAAQATAGTAPSTVARPQEAPVPAAISMQVQFEFGSDRIGAASIQSMQNLALALASAELQGREFTIVGHTDGVGSADYNLRLSQRRAASVKAYLVRNGVESTRLRTEGKGLTQLLNSANPRAAENRRVEIISGG